ncbi:hypothetical protein CC86DRAFT_403658 [Ophiobolus disseminans]|uniref:Uncharacterized protein n=1 Tax=Ophiobolus disseminans TaxID=1469910 RepID=A0A6A7A8H7_9PLEO|nr:hypothetical protein CC86DRAFT_403658 [Ophiobolus disseminans]
MPPEKQLTAKQLNAMDYGFNHLNLPEYPYGNPISEPIYPEAPPKAFNTVEDATQYMELLQKKLRLAHEFIQKEIESGLDPHRNMDRDPTAVLLSTSPLYISYFTQELIRKLIKLRAQADALLDKSEAEQQVWAQEFLWSWTQLKIVVTILMSGRDEEQESERAEIVMESVLGNNMVPGVEVPIEGDGGEAVENEGGDDGTDEDADGESE